MPELKKLTEKEKVNARKAYYDKTSGIGMYAKKIKKGKKGALGSKSEKEKEMEKPEKGTLGSASDAEMEIERALKAEEDAAYARLEKQGMSDQGIVSPGELKEFGKDVYRGAKKKGKEVYQKLKKEGKEFAKGFKEGVKQPIKSMIKSLKGEEKK
jgi:hypothetical protein